eukprot:5175440-Amphidinium_carterae.2
MGLRKHSHNSMVGLSNTAGYWIVRTPAAVASQSHPHTPLAGSPGHMQESHVQCTVVSRGLEGSQVRFNPRP